MSLAANQSPFALRAAPIAAALLLAPLALTGCEREERILDVQTPEGDVEVNRDIDTGEVEVEVTEQ